MRGAAAPSGAEEGHLRGNPFGDGRLRDVGGRLDTQDRHAVGKYCKVAVVARDLDDCDWTPSPNRSTMRSAMLGSGRAESENDEK